MPPLTELSEVRVVTNDALMKAEVEEGDDVGVLEPRDPSQDVEEPADHLAVAADLRVQKLDGDLTADDLVFGTIDRTCLAVANLGGHHMIADDFADHRIRISSNVARYDSARAFLDDPSADCAEVLQQQLGQDHQRDQQYRDRNGLLLESLGEVFVSLFDSRGGRC